MTAGERIRQARKQAGMTQKQLGEAAGIAEPTIRKYESGKLNPKIETLQKISKALNVLWMELVDSQVVELSVSTSSQSAALIGAIAAHQAFGSEPQRMQRYLDELASVMGQYEAWCKEVDVDYAVEKIRQEAERVSGVDIKYFSDECLAGLDAKDK